MFPSISHSSRLILWLHNLDIFKTTADQPFRLYEKWAFRVYWKAFSSGRDEKMNGNLSMISMIWFFGTMLFVTPSSHSIRKSFKKVIKVTKVKIRKLDSRIFSANYLTRHNPNPYTAMLYKRKKRQTAIRSKTLTLFFLSSFFSVSYFIRVW